MDVTVLSGLFFFHVCVVEEMAVVLSQMDLAAEVMTVMDVI